MARKLSNRFFRAPAVELAERLLGTILVSRVGSVRTAGRICEVEVYRGEEDRACHARNGPTPRNRVMYGPPGFAYIYVIYGMYHCLNIVAEPRSYPAAILIRALDPVEGIETMRRRRLRGRRGHGGPPAGALELATGPGRLCQALGLDRRHDGTDLTGETLFLEAGRRLPRTSIERAPRVGLTEACGDWRFRPWNLSYRPELLDGG